MKVKVLRKYKDIELDRVIEKGEVITVSQDRLTKLLGMELVEVVVETRTKKEKTEWKERKSTTPKLGKKQGN